MNKQILEKVAENLHALANDVEVAVGDDNFAPLVSVAMELKREADVIMDEFRRDFDDATKSLRQ